MFLQNLNRYMYLLVAVFCLSCSSSPEKPPSLSPAAGADEEEGTKSSKLDSERTSGKKGWKTSDKPRNIDDELEEEEEEEEEIEEEEIEDDEVFEAPKKTRKVLTDQSKDSCFQQNKGKLKKECNGNIQLDGGIQVKVDINIWYLKECKLMYGEFVTDGLEMEMQLQIDGYDNSVVKDTTTKLETKALFGQREMVVRGTLFNEGTKLDTVTCKHTIL